MAGIGPTSIQPPATIAYHAPVGKPAVGLESPDSKNATLPPVEQSAAGDRLRGDRAASADSADSADADGRRRDDRQRQGDPQPQPEPQPEAALERQSLEPVRAPLAPPPLDVGGLMRALALAASAVSGRNAIRAFDEVRHDRDDIGPHLDQHI